MTAGFKTITIEAEPYYAYLKRMSEEDMKTIPGVIRTLIRNEAKARHYKPNGKTSSKEA